MFSFLSPDSRFMQAVSRFADMVVLNLLFLLTSLPVFTIGAANTAMYTLTFRMLRGREEPIVKSYFRAFRANFRQSTVLWLLFLVAAVPGAVYFDRAYTAEGMLHWLSLPFLSILLLSVFLGVWAFPWASQFSNSTPEILSNALLLSVRNLPRTAALAALQLFPLGLFLFAYDFFLKISFLWLALYFSAAAYLSTAVLWKVFRPYYPEEA